MKRGARRFVAAAVQMRSTDDRERNLAIAERLAAEAARRGARLIAFPENVAYLRAEGTVRPPAEPLDGSTTRRFAEMARRHRAWVLAGTIAEAIPGQSKVHNTSILFDPRGRPAAVYRKIHLFDVAIPGRAAFRESRWIAPGSAPVVARTPLGTLGLSVCYDLRFPELYRSLVFAGAVVLIVPSAFTAYTGALHWETLLRARAIENLAWLVAPAQWGRHHPGRRSFGHTAIVDPWGRVRGLRPRGDGVVTATIDLDEAARARRELPALDHVRPEVYGVDPRPAARRAASSPARAGARSGSRRSASS